jgi:hypothetical protein
LLRCIHQQASHSYLPRISPALNPGYFAQLFCPAILPGALPG